MSEIRWNLSGTDKRCEKDADLRARLNEELGFYPARLDDESIAEYRRRGARDREQIEGYRRMYGSPRSSHWNQFRHLAKGREPRV